MYLDATLTAGQASEERVITVPADMVGKFRVRVVNLSPATHALTNTTVRYRQCVHATV